MTRKRYANATITASVDAAENRAGNTQPTDTAKNASRATASRYVLVE